MSAAATQEQNLKEFFRSSTYDEKYWEEYLLARPEYNDAFYNQILDYYRSHNQDRTETVAHDVGTGPGQVASVLSKYFDSVVATDPNESQLEIGAMLLKKAGLGSNITWAPVQAEDLASKYPAASANLLTAAESIPLIDHRRAMDAFAHVLQPDGTLALSFYGRPASSEPEYEKTCQKLLNEILDRTAEKVVKGVSPEIRAAWKFGIDTQVSFLDNVALPSDIWCDIRRYKWNSHLPMPFNGPDACDFPMEASSNIDEENEQIFETVDPYFWARSWNIKKVRRVVEFLMPSFKDQNDKGAYEHIEPKYQALEQAMGGKEAKRTFTWPMVLILATRR